jgi:hypothetical protein
LRGNSAIYIRLRAICCSEWGCSPPEFEAMAQAGKIAAEDALEAAMLRASAPFSGDLLKYLFRERETKKSRDRSEKMAKIQALMHQCKAEPDEEKKASIRRQMQELNRRK